MYKYTQQVAEMYNRENSYTCYTWFATSRHCRVVSTPVWEVPDWNTEDFVVLVSV